MNARGTQWIIITDSILLSQLALDIPYVSQKSPLNTVTLSFYQAYFPVITNSPDFKIDPAWVD